MDAKTWVQCDKSHRSKQIDCLLMTWYRLGIRYQQWPIKNQWKGNIKKNKEGKHYRWLPKSGCTSVISVKICFILNFLLYDILIAGFSQSIQTKNFVTLKEKYRILYSDVECIRVPIAYLHMPTNQRLFHWAKSPLCLYRVSPLKLLIMLVLFRLLRILLASIIFPCKLLLSKINEYIFRRLPFQKGEMNNAPNKIWVQHSMEKINSSQRDLSEKNVSDDPALSHPRTQKRLNISYNTSTKCSETGTTKEDVSLNWPNWLAVIYLYSQKFISCSTLAFLCLPSMLMLPSSLRQI